MTEKLVYKNKYLSISKEDNYYFYDEKETQVMILPVISKKKFLFVKQYRKPLNRETYEFPAGGCLNKGEKPIDAAVRELSEETGINLSKNKLIQMDFVSTNPQRQRKLVYVYYANITNKDLKNKKKILGPEIKNIEIKTYNQVISLFKNNKIISSVVGFVFLNYLLKYKKKI